MRENPAKIEQLLREIAEQNQSINREREFLDRIEADTHLEIAVAKDENNKSLFSNDTVRKAEFTRQILDDAEYTMTSLSLEKLERDRLYNLALVERLRLEYKLFLLDREAEIAAMRE